MFRFERLFARSSGQPALEVAALKARFAAGAARLAGRPPDTELTRARVADACRDAGLPPATPEEFDARTADLDEEARRRLALAADGLDEPDARSALPRLPGVKGESVRLHVTVKNVGEGKSWKTLATLSDKSGEGIDVEKGRFDVDNLAAGDRNGHADLFAGSGFQVQRRSVTVGIQLYGFRRQRFSEADTLDLTTLDQFTTEM